MRTALVHDWLTGMRGGEKVLEGLLELFPGADLHTLVHRPGTVSPRIEERLRRTSFVQGLPGAERWYRYYLPLMPAAVEGFDLSEYDLVLSSSHCVAKGAIARPDALHVSYVHTPMRYIWDLAPLYFPQRGILGRFLLPHLLTRLRTWDVASSARVDHFVANSSFVAQRIQKYYRREASVVHPPVDTARFAGDAPAGDQYLMVSALVPSKGIELALDAFRVLGRGLRVVGEGPLFETLRSRAPANVRFLGRVGDEELRKLYQGSRALVHTALEDCGIVPLEAAAAGRPTIALGRGGSLDTVVPLERGSPAPPTGVYFHEQSPGALIEAVHAFEAAERHFEPAALRAHARRFDRSVFLQKMSALLDALLERRDGSQVASSLRGARARS